MDDDVDIYSDLPSFVVNECRRCEEKTKEFTEINAILEKESSEWKLKCESLEAEKIIILRNTSSLLKTARAEIDRKDRIITELRQELDNLTFKRNVSGRWKVNNGETRDLRKRHGTRKNNEETTIERKIAVSSEDRPERTKNISDDEKEDPEQKWEPDKRKDTVYGDRLRKKIILEQEAERNRREEAKFSTVEDPVTFAKSTEKPQKSLSNADKLKYPCDKINENLSSSVKSEYFCEKINDNPSDEDKFLKNVESINSATREDGTERLQDFEDNEKFKITRDRNRNDFQHRSDNFNREFRHESRSRHARSISSHLKYDRTCRGISQQNLEIREERSNSNYRRRSKTVDRRYDDKKYDRYREERHKNLSSDRKREHESIKDRYNFIEHSDKNKYDLRKKLECKSDYKFGDRNDNYRNYDSDDRRRRKSGSPGEKYRTKNNHSDKKRTIRSSSRGNESEFKRESTENRDVEKRGSIDRKIIKNGSNDDEIIRPKNFQSSRKNLTNGLIDKPEVSVIKACNVKEIPDKSMDNIEVATEVLNNLINQVDTQDKFIFMLENDSEMTLSPLTRPEIQPIGSRSFREEKIENIEKFIQDYRHEDSGILGTSENLEIQDDNKCVNTTDSIVDTLGMDIDDVSHEILVNGIIENSEFSVNSDFQSTTIDQKLDTIDNKSGEDVIKRLDDIQIDEKIVNFSFDEKSANVYVENKIEGLSVDKKLNEIECDEKLNKIEIDDKLAEAAIDTKFEDENLEKVSINEKFGDNKKFENVAIGTRFGDDEKLKNVSIEAKFKDDKKLKKVSIDTKLEEITIDKRQTEVTIEKELKFIAIDKGTKKCMIDEETTEFMTDKKLENLVVNVKSIDPIDPKSEVISFENISQNEPTDKKSQNTAIADKLDEIVDKLAEIEEKTKISENVVSHTKFDDSAVDHKFVDIFLEEKCSDDEKSKNLAIDKNSKNLAIDEKSKNLTIDEKSENLAIDKKSIKLKIEEKSKNLAIDEKSKNLAIDEKSKNLSIAEKSKKLAIDEKSKNMEIIEKSENLAIDEKSKKVVTEKKLKDLKIDEKSKNSAIVEKSKNSAIDKKSKNVAIYEKSKFFAIDKKSKNMTIDEKSKNVSIDEKSNNLSINESSKNVAIDEKKFVINEESENGEIVKHFEKANLKISPPLPPALELPPLPPFPPSPPPEEREPEIPISQAFPTVKTDTKDLQNLQTEKMISKQMKRRPRIPCIPIVSLYSRKRRALILTDSVASQTVIRSSKNDEKEESKIPQTLKIERKYFSTSTNLTKFCNSKECESSKSSVERIISKTENKTHSENVVKDLDTHDSKKIDSVVSKTENSTIKSNKPEVESLLNVLMSNGDKESKNELSDKKKSSNLSKNIEKKNEEENQLEAKSQRSERSKNHNKIDTSKMSTSTKSSERRKRSVLKTIASTLSSGDTGSSNRKRPISREKENQSKPVKQAKIMIVVRRRPIQLEDSSTASTLVSSKHEESFRDSGIRIPVKIDGTEKKPCMTDKRSE